MRLARLAPSEYTVKTVSVDYQCLCWVPENSYFVPINFIEFSFSVRFTQLSFREPLRTEDTAVFYNIGKVPKIVNYYSIKRSFSLFLGKAILLSHRCFAWRGSLSYIWWTILFLYLGTTELTHIGLSEISLGYVWMHQNLCMLNKTKQIPGLRAGKDSTEISFRCFCGTHRFLCHTHQMLMAGRSLPGAQAILFPHTDVCFLNNLFILIYFYLFVGMHVCVCAVVHVSAYM